MSVVISIDAGTTGVRSFVVDEAGTPQAMAYRELTQHFPRPGWVEHDPLEIWDCVQATLHEVVHDLTEPVAALGITDQRETVVVWDRRTGEPLHRAVVWQDRRTADRCRALEEAGHLPLVRRTAGLVIDPYFSASKLEWLLTEGGVPADEHLAFGTVDAWLLWKLTGGAVHATEPSNASRTLLFDITTGAWSPELLDLFGVPSSCLPEVHPTSGRFGVTADDAACGAGIPISGMAGDQQSALFGQMCVRPGMAKNTYGTGAFTLANVGEQVPDPVDGLLSTVAWTVPASALRAGAGSDVVTHYALEGAIYVAGATVQWLRDGLDIIDDAPAVEALAGSCEDTDGVYLVPAFTGLGSPWWDPYARGTIVGITRGTGRAQIARAALESIAFQTRDVIDAMAAAGGRAIEQLRVDGGAAENDLLLQMQADQIGVPVVRPAVTETTALGAAYLAGLAEGVWGSVQDIEPRWQVARRVEPEVPTELADQRHVQWLRAVERARGWADT